MNIIERLEAFEGSDALGNGDFTVCRKAAALLRECGEALESAREAIAALDAEALGIVRCHPHGDLNNGYAYPIRDELLAKIDAPLAKLSEQSNTRKEGSDAT